mgnify:FL=1
MIQSRLSRAEISHTLSKALTHPELLHPDDSAILFYDLTAIKARVEALKRVFPTGTLHAVAVKANPLLKILSFASGLHTGAEVASLPELYLAEKAGFGPGQIVYDSPCKTREELEYALKTGVSINADSFQELDRIAEILKNIKSNSVIGLRINPQVGPGSIKTTSVADGISKFGIPLAQNREKIIQCYLQYPWLQSIHVHIGSQGCPVPLLVAGIRRVLDLCIDVNELLQQQSAPNRILNFDIGGGLPVSYHPGKDAVGMQQFVSMLQSSCNELFSGQYRIITEYGRYIHANAGWVASKVEYVKREPGYNIIITHVGADLFLRKCYNPADWHHHITVTDKHGNIKTGIDPVKYTVAGPLCFAGDVLATDLELPVVEEGDFLILHDAGAYTLSMWSRYNSRQMPVVIGYHETGNDFEILRRRETPDDLLEFWS